MSLRILVIDDEQLVGHTVQEALKAHGHDVRRAETAKAGLALHEELEPDLVLLDHLLPDAKGIDLIASFTKHPSHPAAVIIITARADAKSAVQALQEGAWDYLVKPLILDELVAKASRFEKLRRLERASQPDPSESSLAGWTPQQPLLRTAVRLAREAAQTDQPVCILGEAGTGRHRLARLIHQASSRANDGFFSWSASQDPERQTEHLAQLVGAEPGQLKAGSPRTRGVLAEAGRGTVVIREVQALPAAFQSVLNQLLDNRTYQPLGGVITSFPGRLILTGAPSLESAGAGDLRIAAELRQQLLGRHILLPPLRDRQQDFMQLLLELTQELNEEYGRSVRGIEPAAVVALMNYPWEGNVGELRLVLSRIWPKVETPRLLRKELPPEFLRNSQRAPLTGQIPTLAEVERQHITRVLDLCQGNQTRAARLLGVARSTLINKMKQYADEESALSK